MTGGIVSVFGGASPQPGSPAYQEAYTVGKLLAEAGFTVATGGYTGVMEAASRGAAEAGGHVIGVTTDVLNQWEAKALKTNSWVKEEIKFPTLRERLYHLVVFCDAAVALAGGIGTLSEVSFMWSLLLTHEIASKPLILLGQQWQDLLTQFYGQGEYIRPEYMQLLKYAQSPEEIIAALNGETAG
jgi:uncharacterized protein (TIGR00730 family)